MFSANDGTHGTELWVTDGTTAGTSLVADIRAGTNSGVPGSIFALGDGRALFSGNDGTTGSELWVTDGTAAGTSLLVDIRAGASSASPANFAALGDGRVLFSANNGTGIELWITDGSVGGTSLVKEIRSGNLSSSPTGFTALGDGRMVFAANNGTNGTELWVTDGTAAGTTQVEDIRPGGGSSGPGELTALGDGRVVFVATDGTNGDELWVTDGTAAGTGLVLDVWPGVGDAYYPSVADLTSLGNGLAVFRGNDGVHGEELWVTDGTAVGTSLLRDFVAGTDGGAPANFLARGDGTVAFTVDDGIHGTELWVTDGTVGGTVQVADVNVHSAGGSFPRGFAASGGEALFAADGAAGLAVWITDGTAAGTRELAATTQSYPSGAEVDGGLRVFAGGDADHGGELWVTDGTAAGTGLLKDIYTGTTSSYASGFFALGNGSVLFSANDGTSGSELWVTDGTADGTVLLKDINPGAGNGYAYGFTALGDGRAVFSATDPTNGNELWVTDGTAAGTTLLKDINPGTGYGAPFGFVSIGGGLLVFSANDGSGYELWVTDGTAGGTSQLKDINTGTDSSYPSFVTSLGNGLALFSAQDASHGNEFWVTDGTAVGTSLLKDIAPGVNSGAGNGIAALGDGRAVLVASGTDPASTGPELWVTDGTTAGTSLLLDIRAGSVGSYPANLVTLGTGTVVFTAFDDTHGQELWVTDGTVAGTSLLKDINVGGDGSTITGVTALGNGTAVFSAFDADHGVELWVTDGTVAGTHLLADIDGVSTAGSNPANLFLLPDNIASDAPTGLDISALQDSGASDTDNVTSTTTLTITGLAAPDVRVTLKDGALLVGQVQSDATTGAWSIDTGLLADGTHRFTATATNASLNTSSGSVALVVKVDTTAPTLAIDQAGGTVFSASRTISGTLTDANPGTLVEIFDNAGVSPIATATVGGGGVWSTSVTLVGLGSHSLVARGSDLADNTGSSAAVVFDLAEPVLAVPTLALAPGSDNGPSTTDRVTGIVAPGFAGVADPGVLVTLREGATVLGSTTANGTTGAWQIASVPLAAGSHSLTATASDGAVSSDPGALDVTIDLRLRSGTAGDDRFTYASHAEFTDPVRWVDGLAGTDRITLTYAAPLTDSELVGLSHLERLVLSGGGNQSVVLAANAAAAFGSQIVLSATASTLEVDASGLGTGTALVAYGTAGTDELTGGSGNDRLYGYAGDDALVGGLGADVLDGGLGADLMTGGADADLYYVDNAGDVTVELTGGGYDRIVASLSWSLGDEFERLTLSGTADIDGTGNALANQLDGSAGANRLEGGVGNDRLLGNDGDDTLIGGEGVDVLHGGLGADRLEGGSEDDLYYVDDAGDVTVELADGGYDRIAASVSWSLGDEFERLSLRGTDAIDGTGNALANRLDGNEGDNLLDGGAEDDRLYGNEGDDTLVGGEGADLLHGGAGADVFVFGEDDSPATATPERAYDIVSDFVTGTDTIDLSTIDGGGLPLGAYAETTSALKDFAAVSAAASTAMASGSFQVVFVASLTNGWLFWNTDADATTAEQAVRLDGLNSTALFAYEDLI
ncbi:beta strand repeat-containing protein [Reyranella humidisoli]|uniref:beta strand repeat-containing protein n=1 Tax=Reyranella humidisoli TaxID=2849149 RepID=UPI0034E1D471